LSDQDAKSPETTPVEPEPDPKEEALPEVSKREEPNRGPFVRGGWPPRDRHDRKLPWKLNTITMFRAVPILIRAFNVTVPEEFWSVDEDEDGEPLAVIACQCGEEPKLRVAKTAECQCGRFFLFTGQEVRCFRPENDAQEQAES
jgi:hypothetical protein